VLSLVEWVLCWATIGWLGPVLGCDWLAEFGAALSLVEWVLCCSAIGWLSPVLLCHWLAELCAALSLVGLSQVLFYHWLAGSCASLRLLLWDVLSLGLTLLLRTLKLVPHDIHSSSFREDSVTVREDSVLFREH